MSYQIHYNCIEKIDNKVRKKEIEDGSGHTQDMGTFALSHK